MPPKTWACAPNSEEEASIKNSKEDASIEDNREDAKDMEVSSNDESDEGGNHQFPPPQWQRQVEKVYCHHPTLMHLVTYLCTYHIGKFHLY